MADIAKLRGEGGVVWEFDLPLNEVFTNQVKTRALVPADDASYDLVRHLLEDEVEDAGDETTEPEAPAELTLADRIDAVDSHAAANELGVELGLTFEEKKPGLDAKKAALLEAAAAQAAE